MILKLRDTVKEREENEVEFWLERDGDGDVSLYAKSSQDKSGAPILFITKEGKLRRYLDCHQVTGISYVEHNGRKIEIPTGG